MTKPGAGTTFRYMSQRSNTTDTERLAEMFKALSNPNRMRIFSIMSRECGPGSCRLAGRDVQRCVGDLGKGMGIAPSTVSHHVKELKRAGLIRVERRGKTILCSIDPGAVRSLAAFFAKRVDTERSRRIRSARKES
ncbi:MAG: helix-turn-helix transcriptional regulator [Acidobacteria bacterium]|nr:helix-turn-helix transcriptional regulator [Acidobacteriota bacterium]